MGGNDGHLDSFGETDPFTGLVPVGTILAWHKALAGTPDLPLNFVECNGQVLDDDASIYSGLTIPDLNGDSRHLEGSVTSGTETAAVAAASGAGGGGSPDTFTVVWIMRVK